MYYMLEDEQPNEETVQVMEDIVNGENVEEFDVEQLKDERNG